MAAMAARVAMIDMTTERGRPTARDRAQHGALLHAEPRMLLDEVITLRVGGYRHLHGGPGHDSAGFFAAAETGGARPAGDLQLLERFGAACKWRRDRCR